MSIPEDNILYTEQQTTTNKNLNKAGKGCSNNAATICAFLKVMFSYTTRTKCEPIAKYVNKEEAIHNFVRYGYPLK
jgi:hypothetical protein